MSRPAEKCCNPWKTHCETTAIEVYIMREGYLLPICSDCWRAIADENYEWRR